VGRLGRRREATEDYITCRLTKAAHTLRICNTYCFSTATMFTRTRQNLLRLYIQWLPCLILNRIAHRVNTKLEKLNGVEALGSTKCVMATFLFIYFLTLYLIFIVMHVQFRDCYICSVRCILCTDFM
jgi:hypothetical protein